MSQTDKSAERCDLCQRRFDSKAARLAHVCGEKASGLGLGGAHAQGLSQTTSPRNEGSAPAPPRGNRTAQRSGYRRGGMSSRGHVRDGRVGPYPTAEAAKSLTNRRKQPPPSTTPEAVAPSPAASSASSTSPSASSTPSPDQDLGDDQQVASAATLAYSLGPSLPEPINVAVSLEESWFDFLHRSTRLSEPAAARVFPGRPGGLRLTDGPWTYTLIPMEMPEDDSWPQPMKLRNEGDHREMQQLLSTGLFEYAVISHTRLT